MTKSARAKKNKKADFAKVKLKVGKKLKKAQNETRTDFKTRKIILKEQLSRKSEEGLLTKKKRNVKDLLTCLGHTNTYVRQDGLNGLLELVKNNETEELIPKLSQIISGVASCMFDIDVLIRSATIKFIEALLVKVGIHVEPYFSVLATHLSCAMVHLNTGVQADSLRLVNLFVKHTPALLARHANTLISNFVNLISRKASGSHTVPGKKEVFVDFTRMLHTNPSNTLTTHKGHVELLQQLSGFLEIILKEQGQVEERVPLTMWQRVMAGSLAPMVCGSTGRDATQHTWLFSDPQLLEKFVRDIVPLLFQVWAEVDPKNHEDMEEDNLLNEEGVKALSSILSIISHLMNMTQVCTKQQPKECEWFVGQLNSKYMSKIMSGFPYYRHTSQMKIKKKNRSTNKTEPSMEDCSIMYCDHLNVTLATLAVQLSPSSHFQDKAVSFLTKLLCDKTHDGEYNMSAVLKVLLHLLSQADGQDAQELVQSAFSCYKRLHPLRKDRTLLLQVLMTATHITNPTLWQCWGVDQWVTQMGEELASAEVQEAALETAIDLKLQANTSLNRLLAARKEQVTENLQQRGVPGMTKSSLSQRMEFLLKNT
ncbi:Testis-expressed protein 10 [Chionoecetes opilio]|uniref:Testis-expressed protein 10 n=1 Tax=Chionoecetes opilio TaxID=41210 RepID=A0A8J5CW62_CHIOP|nr:Testis-expressed protein 10 [Chionoecetes opilio]